MENNAGLWNWIAGSYDRFVALTSKKTHVALHSMLKDDVGKVENLLEAATGTGALALDLASCAERVEAVDLSEGMLRVARAKAEAAGVANIRFRQGNICSLEYPDGHFDAVVACNVLHLLDDPAGAVRELARVARPDAPIFLPTFLLGGVRGRLFCAVVRLAGVRVPNRWTREGYLRFLEECGLTIRKDVVLREKVPLCYAVAGRTGA